jgi:hypothetical protein
MAYYCRKLQCKKKYGFGWHYGSVNGYRWAFLSRSEKNGKLDIYEDFRLPRKDRVNDLLSQMTL